MAVLQRIALCYFAVSLFAVYCNHRYTVPAIIVLLTLYTAILLFGNGYAQDADINVLAQFDLYFGNLSGRNAYVDFRNAADQRVAGFSLNRYNGTVAYNEFNDVLEGNGGQGLDIRQYATGVGSSSAANAAICVASNCSQFTLEVDYANKTVKGSLLNGKGQTVEGAPMPFRPDTDIADQLITKFVVGSNYNNNDRMCWFDNLKIEVIQAGATEPFVGIENAKAAAAKEVPVKVFENGQIIIGGKYNAAGAVVK